MERLRLIEESRETLRETTELVVLTDAQRQELGGRLDEIGRRDAATVPWEDQDAVTVVEFR